MKRLFALVVLLSGVVILARTAYLVWQRYDPHQTEVRTTVNTDPTVNPNEPSYIDFPSLKLSLPIFASAIKNGSWEISAHGVSYLSTSALPGAMGNSVLYGHNWQNILGKLPNIQVNDPIRITFANGAKRLFSVTSVSSVSPDDTKILAETKTPRLTIYTCEGTFDQKRFVVYASLMK
jgi:LPXTG-site transpeptidase (sortase) family protein